jgi:hypothetical protein
MSALNAAAVIVGGIGRSIMCLLLAVVILGVFVIETIICTVSGLLNLGLPPFPIDKCLYDLLGIIDFKYREDGVIQMGITILVFAVTLAAIAGIFLFVMSVDTVTEWLVWLLNRTGFNVYYDQALTRYIHRKFYPDGEGILGEHFNHQQSMGFS